MPIHTELTVLLVLVMLMFAQTSCAKHNPNIYPLDKAYYREASLQKELKALADQYPQEAKLHIIGYSGTDKKPIYALQIQTDLQRTPVLVIGQHHGDEVIGVQIAMALAKQLLEQPDNSRIRQLKDAYAFWIVPTLNPEAFRIVTSGKFEWKRKTNTDTNKNRKLDLLTDGVDINRNYPTFWSVGLPLPEYHPYYRGASPASEAEVQALLKLAELVRFRYLFSYHSSVTGTFNEKIYLPWQNRSDKSNRIDFDRMRDLADLYASAVTKDYAPGTYLVHPGQTSKLGNSRNHFYYEYGTFAYDIEVGGIDAGGVSVIHPKADIMQSIVSKHISALEQALLYANAEMWFSSPEPEYKSKNLQ